MTYIITYIVLHQHLNIAAINMYNLSYIKSNNNKLLIKTISLTKFLYFTIGNSYLINFKQNYHY